MRVDVIFAAAFLLARPILASSDSLKSLSWPLCGRVQSHLDELPPNWTERSGCPASRSGAAYVDGMVSKRFGLSSAEGGLHEGLSIDCEAGTPVFVVADGVVKKVADGVVVAHWEEGWDSDYVYTAYTRLGHKAVQEGEAVKRGQLLGRCGRCEDGQSRLLFRVLRGRTLDDSAFVHPLRMLPYEEDEGEARVEVSLGADGQVLASVRTARTDVLALHLAFNDRAEGVAQFRFDVEELLQAQRSLARGCEEAEDGHCGAMSSRQVPDVSGRHLLAVSTFVSNAAEDDAVTFGIAASPLESEWSCVAASVQLAGTTRGQNPLVQEACQQDKDSSRKKDSSRAKESFSAKESFGAKPTLRRMQSGTGTTSPSPAPTSEPHSAEQSSSPPPIPSTSPSTPPTLHPGVSDSPTSTSSEEKKFGVEVVVYMGSGFAILSFVAFACGLRFPMRRTTANVKSELEIPDAALGVLPRDAAALVEIEPLNSPRPHAESA